MSTKKGKKFDAGKPRIDLIPIEFLIGVGQAFAVGVETHGEDNYRLGIEHRRLLASALRHILMELSGIPIDDGTQQPHWANAGASLAMYAFMQYNRPELDNRYRYSEKEKNNIERLMYGTSTEISKKTSKKA